MFSIYTVIHTIPSDIVDYKSALDNFCAFADEVCVATTIHSEDDKTIELLQEYQKTNPKLKFVITKSSIYSPPGEMKNAALKICTEPYCILLDLDERIRLADKPVWIELANLLNNRYNVDALLIPSIDLFNSEKEYKSLGFKWYLHKNLKHLMRGSVNFARRTDGTIDINKSDSSELIHSDGTLCRCIQSINPLTIDNIKTLGAKVFHLGWIDKFKRLESHLFAQKVWDGMSGKPEAKVIHSMVELDAIKYFPHNLKLWYE